MVKIRTNTQTRNRYRPAAIWGHIGNFLQTTRTPEEKQTARMRRLDCFIRNNIGREIKPRRDGSSLLMGSQPGLWTGEKKTTAGYTSYREDLWPLSTAVLLVRLDITSSFKENLWSFPLFFVLLIIPTVPLIYSFFLDVKTRMIQPRLSFHSQPHLLLIVK